MKKLAIKLIRAYQYFSRNIVGHNPIFIVAPVCKFYPTCSEYSIEAINKYGFFSGSAKSFLRILKCNPFYNNH
jgi:putative membrane protein insertion efficiency factor